MAQSVERRIGSAEVTGPIPVTSFLKVQYLLDFLFYHKKLLVCSGKTTRIYKGNSCKFAHWGKFFHVAYHQDNAVQYPYYSESISQITP